VHGLTPQEVTGTVAPLVKALLQDPYADVRAAALRQVAAVGERSAWCRGQGGGRCVEVLLFAVGREF